MFSVLPCHTCSRITWCIRLGKDSERDVRSAFCKREDTLAAAAEARTQMPMEGVRASSLDEIEPAQRTAGHGEWWGVNFGTTQSVGSKQEACVLFFLLLFFQKCNFFCGTLIGVHHVTCLVSNLG